MKTESHSLAETEVVAKKFLEDLKPGKTATVVGLSGNLGSGKTAFVKAVAKILGVAEPVLSPTFVLMKLYTLNPSPYRSSTPFAPMDIGAQGLSELPACAETASAGRQVFVPQPYTLLIHIDAYRLESGEELAKLRIAEIFNDPHNLVFIEWPENVKSVLPKNIHIIHFEFIDEKTRIIKFS